MSCLCINTYICVRGRSFSNFRFVIFKQRVSEKRSPTVAPIVSPSHFIAKSRRSRRPRKHSPPGPGSTAKEAIVLRYFMYIVAQKCDNNIMYILYEFTKVKTIHAYGI